jgi:two-component system, chemotaxis family, CheB/CheR fusion protein
MVMVVKRRPTRRNPRQRHRPSRPERRLAAETQHQLEQDQLLAELETLREAQIEIEHSQQLYAELFDLAPIGYLNLTVRGRIQNANLAACALLERSRNSLIGMNFSVFVMSRDKPKFIDYLKHCEASSADGSATELRLLTGKSQEPRYVELLSRTSTLFGTTETIHRTVLRDITARRKAEKALLESEEQTRALSANLPGGAAFILDHRLRYLVAGGEALAILGRGSQAFVGRTMKKAIGPDMAGVLEPLCRNVLAGRPFTHEHMASGRTFLSRGAPLRDATGAIYAALIVSYDITERKQAEEALRKSEEKLRLMIESAHEYAIFTMDLDMRVTSWNPGAERLLGFSEKEIVGRTADVIYTVQDRAARRPEVEKEQALANGRAEDQRWHLRKDGKPFWSNGFLMPMHDNLGRPVGLVKILRDDTETRQAQQALERSRQQLLEALKEKERAREEAVAASKAKDHFLAVLSHELRTPLTPVLLAAQLLARRNDLPADVYESLEMIRNNVRIESQFIDDLLDMTRIAQGKVEIAREAVNVHDAIKRAVQITHSDLEAKNQRLVISLNAKRNEVTGDRTRLQQVFWNLLKNASKFTPEGGEIRIESRNENNRIAAVVSDQGIGIEPDALPLIFNSFMQASEQVTREFGGLGLGLAISKATVDAHEGTLRAESRGSNKGATFTVELPLRSNAKA